MCRLYGYWNGGDALMQIRPILIRLECDQTPYTKRRYGKYLFFIVGFIGIIVLFM